LQTTSIAYCHSFSSLIWLLQGEIIRFRGDVVISTAVKIPRLL